MCQADRKDGFDGEGRRCIKSREDLCDEFRDADDLTYSISLTDLSSLVSLQPEEHGHSTS